MRYKTLPNTDIRVSTLCLGTMNFGQQNSETDAHEQLDFAFEKGINLIDTAEIYPIPPEMERQGRTETFIGTWLAKRKTRGDVIVASKVASRNQSVTMRTRNAKGGLIRANIFEAVEGSLSRLQTDYLDLYQVHSPERHTNNFGIRGFEKLDGDDGATIEETLSALSELVKSGKVRAIGISNETPWGTNEYLRLAREKSLTKISTIQNQYSLLNRTFEVGLSEICLREDIGLMPYSVLNMGVLTGKYLDGAKPPKARFTLWDRNSSRYNPPHTQLAAHHYTALAKKYGITPAQLAISFVESRPFVTSVILAATTISQLEDTIAASSFECSPDMLTDIRHIYTEHPDPTC